MESGSIIAGRYRLVRRIGQGGLASVWEAEHIALASQVAIKFLHRTGPRDGELSQRFLREARIAASVKHRNVLDILDFGFTEARSGDASVEDGVPYMVMELLNGRTLGALLAAEKAIDTERAVAITLGMLRGLAAVHDAGLVHRDMKPDNVFLVEDEDGAFPKLLDFGLSRRAGRGDLTSEGMLLGTPQYMSPEQAAGNGDLDARTDIYAVGAVLYEMLAGRRPFPTASLSETLDRVVNDAPTPLREVAPQVPGRIVEVVETAMAKDRERRFVDARAMRSALMVAAPASTSSQESPSVPRMPVVDAYARTLAAAPAVVLPPDLRTPTHASKQEKAPEKHESGLVVAMRVLVLVAITAGVAVLVLDLPWASLGAQTTPPDALVATVGPDDAMATTDASVIALAIDGEPDAGPSDAGWDAAAIDAAIEDAAIDDAWIEDAAVEDAWIEDAAVEVDAASDIDAASELVPEELDAGPAEDEVTPTASAPDAGRARAPSTQRRVTPHHPPPRPHRAVRRPRRGRGRRHR